MIQQGDRILDMPRETVIGTVIRTSDTCPVRRNQAQSMFPGRSVAQRKDVPGSGRAMQT